MNKIILINYTNIPQDAVLNKIKVLNKSYLYFIKNSHLYLVKLSKISNLNSTFNNPLKDTFNLYPLFDPLTQILLVHSQSKFSNQFKGLRFKLNGRLRGASRARNIKFNFGRINSQTFNSHISYFNQPLFSKWGTLGCSISLSRS